MAYYYRYYYGDNPELDPYLRELDGTYSYVVAEDDFFCYRQLLAIDIMDGDRIIGRFTKKISSNGITRAREFYERARSFMLPSSYEEANAQKTDSACRVALYYNTETEIMGYICFRLSDKEDIEEFLIESDGKFQPVEIRGRKYWLLSSTVCDNKILFTRTDSKTSSADVSFDDIADITPYEIDGLVLESIMEQHGWGRYTQNICNAEYDKQINREYPSFEEYKKAVYDRLVVQAGESQAKELMKKYEKEINERAEYFTHYRYPEKDAAEMIMGIFPDDRSTLGRYYDFIK